MSCTDNFKNHDVSWTIAMVQGVQFYQEEDDHILMRRFKRLHLYNLHYKHERLVALDGRMRVLEQRVLGLPKTNVDDPIPDIAEIAGNIDGLMKEIDQALRDFDIASEQFRRSAAATKVPAYYIAELKNATKGDKWNAYSNQYNSSAWSECAFHVSKPKGVIHSYIDQVRFLRMLFVKDRKDRRSAMLYYSESAVRAFEDIAVNVSFGLLVLVPIIVLSFLKNKVEKLVLVLLFVLLSSIVATVLANATQKSSIAVVAAYTAILVVFLSNNPGS